MQIILNKIKEFGGNKRFCRAVGLTENNSTTHINRLIDRIKRDNQKLNAIGLEINIKTISNEQDSTKKV